MRPSLLFTLSLAFLLLGNAAQAQPSAPSRPWWKDSVFYEIFVRSFQDSNGDGIGDLNGVTSRLDYVQNLGANALWLMPIFTSPSYHGYDAIDYRAVNPDYGTMDDFKNLVAQSHARGIRVILDLAINHTSDQAPAFQAGLQNAQSPLESLYLWFEQAITPWKGMGHFVPVAPHRYYYATFSKNMPDLNWHNPAVLTEVESILHYWSALGVDGFRLDAARYYVKGPEGETDTPGTHQAIEAFTQNLKRDYPNAFFVGEVWADAATIGPYVNTGRELDLAFDFPVSGGLVTSLESENAAPFLSSLRAVSSQVRSGDSLGTFITNHDMIRVASDVKGNTAQLKLGAAALFTLPGTPFVYYGEELGLPNGPTSNDLDKRTPMPWDMDTDMGRGAGFTTGTPWKSFSTLDPSISVAAEAGDPSSVLETYRRWIHTRTASETLAHGGFHLLDTSNLAAAAYVRTSATEKMIVVLNFGAKPIASLSVDMSRFSGFRVSGVRNLTPDSCRFQVQPNASGAPASMQLTDVAPFSANLIQVLGR
jgi:glycosidase